MGAEQRETRKGDKPRYRGLSHQYAFFVFLVANACLLSCVSGEQATRAVWVYAASLAFLYGVSSMYHRGVWSEGSRKLMRSLDHSGIFILIAGSYTPLFMLLTPEAYGADPLMMMWILAALGVGKSILWSQGPKWITAMLAIAMGWSAIVYAFDMRALMGAPSFALLVACGLVYTAGGIIFAVRRPDPLPEVFGYHEVFHALVITGSLLHYGHALLVLDAVGALAA